MGKFEIATIGVIAVFAGLWFGLGGKSDAPVSASASGIQQLDPVAYETRILNGQGLSIVEFGADW